jgi:hypothetical protein
LASLLKNRPFPRLVYAVRYLAKLLFVAFSLQWIYQCTDHRRQLSIVADKPAAPGLMLFNELDMNIGQIVDNR